jgi:hypothetical protein
MDPVLVDNRLQLPACAFEYVQHTFDHWEINGESHAAGDIVDVTGDVVVVAVWREKSCLVSFDANGGTGVMQSVDVPVTVGLMAPECEFLYQKHRFVSWNTAADGSGTSYAVGAPVDVSMASQTLYAQWEEKGHITLMNGATVVWSDIADGTSLDGYVIPSVTGFELVGWYADYDILSGLRVNADGTGIGDVVDSDGVFDVHGDVVLHALWRGSVFVPVTGFGLTGENTREFVIVNSFDVGAHTLLSRTSNGGVSGTSVQVKDMHAFGSDAADLGLCMIGVPDNCVWVGQWRRDNTDVSFFSLTAKGVTSGKRYLRGNNNNVELSDTLMYGTSYSNKQMWSYGVYGQNTLICENQVFEARTMKRVGWTSTKWSQETTTASVSLLGSVDDAYVFDIE